MLFLKFLKTPLQHDKDVDKASIVDILMILGIAIVFQALTLFIISNTFVKSALTTSGVSIFIGNIPLKYYFILVGITGVATVVAMAVISGILFVINKIINNEAKIENGCSLFSTAYFWPAIIIPVSILGLLFGDYSIIVITLVMIVSIIIFAINLYEALKIIGIGSGISLYIVPGLVILYYGIIASGIYFSIQLIINQYMNSFNNLWW